MVLVIMKKIFAILFLLTLVNMPSVVRAETPPTAPFDLVYKELGGMQVRLDWTAPESDGGSAIEGYNVTYTINGKGPYTEPGVLENTYTTKTLTADIYEFWVTAYNAFGESEQSNRITFNLSPSGDVTAPVITSGPTITKLLNSDAVIYWDTDEPSTTSIIFDVHSSGPHNSINIKSLITNHEIPLSGLLPCTTYFYKLYSTDVDQNTVSYGPDSFKTTGCLGGILEESDSELGLPVNPLTAFLGKLGIEVSLPADSFEIESVFQIKKLDIGEVDANVGCPTDNKPIGGRIYDVKILEEYNKEAALKKPATITMSYAHDELAGVDESSISMFHYDEGSSGWVKLNSCTLDKEKDEITCLTDSFSKFMIAVEEEYICEPFYWNLALGTYHNDVLRLQEFLNKKGFLDLEASKPDSKNKFFNLRILRALKEFQKSSGVNGLERSLGILGPKTREVINSL